MKTLWKLHLSLIEDCELFKQFLSGKALGVSEIHPKMLRALNIVGLFCLTSLFNVAWRSGTVPVDGQIRVGIPISRKEGLEAALKLLGYHTAYARVLEMRLWQIIEP